MRRQDNVVTFVLSFHEITQHLKSQLRNLLMLEGGKKLIRETAAASFVMKFLCLFAVEKT